MAEAGAPRVIVVAGMHRAGTSVIARALQALGFPLGDALMSADVRQNARGFFEDVDIVRLDDALLEANGADWKSVALLDDVDWTSASLDESCAAAARLLDAKLGEAGEFAFKDPRVPRLLPFWQRVLARMDVADAYVIAVRHPCAVIDSLTARDGLDVRRSGWLWLTHVACALRYTQGRPRVVVDFDRMLAAPARELARMAAALGLPPSVLERPEIGLFTRDFLAEELRHSEYLPGEVPDGVPPGVKEAHALAQRLARDDVDPGAGEAAREIDALFARLSAVSPILAYAGAAERLADQVPRLAGELAWARESLAEATSHVAGLEAAIAAKDAYVAQLEAALARKEAELVSAHALLARVGENVVGRIALRRARR